MSFSVIYLNVSVSQTEEVWNQIGKREGLNVMSKEPSLYETFCISAQYGQCVKSERTDMIHCEKVMLLDRTGATL